MAEEGVEMLRSVSLVFMDCCLSTFIQGFIEILLIWKVGFMCKLLIDLRMTSVHDPDLLKLIPLG